MSKRRWVNLSISPSEEAAALGFDEYAINRIAVRLAQFLLFRDYNVAFGHDWREDGVMRAVAELAETAASGGRLNELHDGSARMLNLVAQARDTLSKEALGTAALAGNILRVHALDDRVNNGDWQGLLTQAEQPFIATRIESLSGPGPHPDRACQLWVLRYALTRLSPIGCRICVGGKTAAYQGYYAGVAEEAYLALRHGQPLYLIGGFGGVAGAVASVLADPQATAHDCLNPPNKPDTDALAARQRMAAALDLPLSGLAAWFGECGLGGLARGNGLSEEQNLRLFACTDIEAALGLIAQGLRVLAKRG
ncbi:MAG: hypothetical protein GKR94_14980 [Gammaproteobacteria bacterium]|nr:hypothetical protein [Gammaproteobacteria bacterium]